MEADRDFRAEQRAVVARMGLALAATCLALWAAWHAGRGDVPPTLEIRLRMAATAGLVPAAWLALAIGDVARRRFLSPGAIGGGDQPELSAARAMLTNTLEQTALAWPVWFALALAVERPASPLIAVAGLFSLGRLMFRFGWSRGAAARAFGFGLTFYPTVVALGLVVVALLR